MLSNAWGNKCENGRGPISLRRASRVASSVDGAWGTNAKTWSSSRQKVFIFTLHTQCTVGCFAVTHSFHIIHNRPHSWHCILRKKKKKKHSVVSLPRNRRKCAMGMKMWKKKKKINGKCKSQFSSQSKLKCFTFSGFTSASFVQDNMTTKLNLNQTKNLE